MTSTGTSDTPQQSALSTTTTMTSSSSSKVTQSPSALSEKDKMLRGEFYQAFDEELLQERQRAKELCFRFNQLSPLDKESRQALLLELLSPPFTSSISHPSPKNAWVESPFHVDYGYLLQVGDNFYANHGCTILDCNYVRIGKNCLLAPHVCISAATHPVDPTLRANGAEFTAPITIGDNAWIGANATICPGVTLGNNVVVGAGAVVTKDFPDNVVIGGVPAKIIKEIPPPTSETNK
jgi:maltose O-acetyltransferase